MTHIPFPDKKYDIIYADPPWRYGCSPMSSASRSCPENHYPTMTFQELSDLPIQSIASDNCLLFLWASGAVFMDISKIGTAWGFEFSTVGFVWDKQISLPANYTIPQCEFCLTFKKGNIPEPRGKRNIRQFLSCKKGAHSVKPLEIQHRITEMFPTQSKIELFARPSPLFKGLDDGWDHWGNET